MECVFEKAGRGGGVFKLLTLIIGKVSKCEENVPGSLTEWIFFFKAISIFWT